jgi:hypothetical protein
MSKLQLSRKFVQEAYNAADSNWKDRITKEFPKLLQSFILEELGGMVLECYKLNKKDYTDFTFSYISIVPADDTNFHVAVKLPNANIDWTLSAFAFIRHFVEYMKAKGIYTYPRHCNESVKEVSEKLGWDSSRCLLIYVQPSTWGLVVDDKELFETSEEFVREAYKATYKDWKNKIEEQFPELFKTEKTYPLGTRVRINSSLGNDEYILVAIQDKSYLINIVSGKPWDVIHMNLVDRKVTYSQLEKYVETCPFHIL